MADTPENINPATDPQVEDPASTAVPLTDAAALAEAEAARQEAAAAAVTENIKLREELVAAKEQIDSGTPLSDTQVAALEQQAQATAAADAQLAAAEQAVVETNPTVLNVSEDPQIEAPTTDPLPSLDTVQTQPVEATPAEDPEIASLESARNPAIVATDIEFDPATVTTADPQAPVQSQDLPPALVYETGTVPTQDSIVLAQADSIVTDVPVSSIDIRPIPVNQNLDPTAPAEPAAPSSFYEEPAATSDPSYPSGVQESPRDSDIIQTATDVTPSPAEFTEQDQGFQVLNEEAEPLPEDFVETDTGFLVQQQEIQDQIDQTQFEDQAAEFEPAISESDIIEEPEDISLDNLEYQDEPDDGRVTDLSTGQRVTAEEAAAEQAAVNRARQQAILQQQRKQANDGDWRVKLRLAPGAEYLYRAPLPGILQPLTVTDGVVFPYTPQITTAYKANYSSYDLTHSNYRGYFYQGSQVEDIQIQAKFTAQDSNEANYLLAVIHFFRSITKMFYGQDAQRGAPPPLVFLQGFGEYQFNLAPCVVAQFNYVLPDNVDYIRAGSPNINGTNLLQRRSRQDLPTNIFTSAWGRLQSVLGAQGIKKGAIPSPPAPPTLGTNRPTYVPTAMDMTIILHPIQSRSQVSKQFSLKQYANGDLLKGGFW